MKFIHSYYTDIGTTREKNQDSLALIKADTDFGEVLLTIVCDGMGGCSAGELASKYCVESFALWFRGRFPELLYDAFSDEILEGQWRSLVASINHKLVTYGKAYQMELGSTLTACLFCRGKYYIAHVGDSRCYLITDQGAKQLTRDHSVVAAEVEKGILTAAEAKKDRRRNVLYESVGITNRLNMEFYHGKVETGQSFLLCSDGFWHFLSEKEIVRYLSAKTIKDNKMMRMHLNYLVEQVKTRGERDNISAIGAVPLVSEEMDSR